MWNLWPHTRSKSGGGDDSKHTGHICTASLLALAAPMSSHNTHPKIVVSGRQRVCGIVNIKTVIGICECGVLIVLIFRHVFLLNVFTELR